MDCVDIIALGMCLCSGFRPFGDVKRTFVENADACMYLATFLQRVSTVGRWLLQVLVSVYKCVASTNSQ